MAEGAMPCTPEDEGSRHRDSGREDEDEGEMDDVFGCDELGVQYVQCCMFCTVCACDCA